MANKKEKILTQCLHPKFTIIIIQCNQVYLLWFKGGNEIGGIPGMFNGACRGGNGPGKVPKFGNVDCAGRAET